LPGREAEHSLTYIAEVKSVAAIIPLPHNFSGLNVYLVKHKGNFTSNLCEVNILQIYFFFVMNIFKVWLSWQRIDFILKIIQRTRIYCCMKCRTQYIV
jgi:hypothetical protein